MSIFEQVKNRIICFKTQHDYKYDSDTLGGDWIRCERCGNVDEFLPGLHEPKGYK